MKARKALALTLSAAMMCSMISMSALAADETGEVTPPVSTGAVAPKFSDVDNHWGANSIGRWAESGIVKGDEKGNFNPDATLTRAELAQIFVNMFGLTEKAENTYADLTGSEWYADAILKCTAAGIMQGDGSSCNAEQAITRQETMVMFGRAMGVIPASEPDLSAFQDGAGVPAWAAGYLAPLAAMGIITGSGDGNLAAGNAIDRASTMALLDKAVVEYVNESGEVKVDNANGFVVVNVKDGKVVISGNAAGLVVAAGTAEGEVVAKDLTADSAKVDGAAGMSLEGKSDIGTMTANTSGTLRVGSGSSVGIVVANAPVKLENRGTVKELVANESGVTISGKAPEKTTTADGVEEPKKESSGGNGGGVPTPSTPDDVEIIGVNFLYFKPEKGVAEAEGSEGEIDVIDLAQFESDFRTVTSATYTGDDASLEALKALDTNGDGKVALDAADDVFINLPWVGVHYTVNTAFDKVEFSYQKNGVAGTFKEKDGTANATVEVSGAVGSHWFSVCIGDPVAPNDTGLGYTGDSAYGTYAFNAVATKDGKVEWVNDYVSADYTGVKADADFLTVSFETAGSMAAVKLLKDADGNAKFAAVPGAPDYGTQNYVFNGWFQGDAAVTADTVFTANATLTAKEHDATPKAVNSGVTDENDPFYGMVPSTISGIDMQRTGEKAFTVKLTGVKTVLTGENDSGFEGCYNEGAMSYVIGLVLPQSEGQKAAFTNYVKDQSGEIGADNTLWIIVNGKNLRPETAGETLDNAANPITVTVGGVTYTLDVSGMTGGDAITVKTAESLANVLKNAPAGTTVTIDGTLGSTEAYGVYTIDKALTLQGGAVYGSFVVKADGVTFDGMDIYNKGDDKAGVERNGINAYTKELTVKGCKFFAGSEFANGLMILPSDGNVNFSIEGNTFTGFMKTIDKWSTTAILITCNYPLDNKPFFGAAQGTMSAGEIEIDDLGIITGNTFVDCKNDYTHNTLGEKTTIQATSNSSTDNFRLSSGVEGSMFYVTGSVTRGKEDTTIPAGVTLAVTEGNTLTVGKGITLTVNGALTGVVVGADNTSKLVIGEGGSYGVMDAGTYTYEDGHWTIVQDVIEPAV